MMPSHALQRRHSHSWVSAIAVFHSLHGTRCWDSPLTPLCFARRLIVWFPRSDAMKMSLAQQFESVSFSQNRKAKSSKHNKATTKPQLLATATLQPQLPTFQVQTSFYQSQQTIKPCLSSQWFFWAPLSSLLSSARESLVESTLAASWCKRNASQATNVIKKKSGPKSIKRKEKRPCCYKYVRSIVLLKY